MQKSTAIGELFRLLFQVVSVFFLIPSFLLFCLGCYRIAPETFAPVLKQDSFRAGQLAVDSTYYVPGAEGGRATKYSVGHIIEQEGANVHEYTVDASEISPADTDPGDVVTVYYALEFKKVYLRKPRESLKRMPAYKVVSPFMFGLE